MRITRYLKSSKRKDGTRQIYIRERTLDFHTGSGIYVKETEWDATKQCIKGRTKEIDDWNLILSDIEARIKDIFVKYRLKDRQLTREILKSEFYNPQVGLDFISFAWDYFKKHADKLKPGTRKKQKSVLKKLDQIFDGELLFSNLNENAILKIERDLNIIYGNNRNTIVSNIKIIKKYINAAVRQELLDKNPAHGMGFKYVKSDRTSLDIDELEKIEHAYSSGKYSHAAGINRSLKNYLFMCYTGLRISDFRNLKQKNIINNALVLVMEKTNTIKTTTIYIPLTQRALELINSEKTGNDHLFVNRPEQKINADLKRIAKDAEIDKVLTIHTARHTFATLYLKATNDLAGLQELLGHDSIDTTRQYIHIDQEHLKRNMKAFEDFRS